MGTPVNLRVRKRREALRAAGLRPVQIWAIDTRSPEFQVEARRQSILLARADADDPELLNELDAAFDEALAELEGDEIPLDLPDDRQ